MELPELTPPAGLLDGREALAAALRRAISEARRDLCFMDRDLSDWPIEEPAVAARIERLLARSRRASVRMLVQDQRWLERSAPRLAALRRRAGGTVEVRRIADDAEGAVGGLLIADADCAVERFHWDAYRGRLVAASTEAVEPLRRRFDRLWDGASPCLPVTTLGL